MPALQRCLLLIALAMLCGRSVPAAETNPCPSSHFAQEGTDLYKSVSHTASSKPGVDIVLLCDEETYVFDAQGKSVHTLYSVYKVITQNGADGWDSVSINWGPWSEDRPVMRARVITPDGFIHPLDAKTISDAPARDEDDKPYGDGRVERAPLPAIAPGSGVEEEEVVTENVPFFGAGIVSRDYFG